MNDPSQQHIGTPALIRRFAPYLMRYKRILIFDLFCAALTTLCDIVANKQDFFHPSNSPEKWLDS